MSKPLPLPKLIMLPVNGEYKIIPIPAKPSLLATILSNAAIGLILFLIVGFILNVIFTVNMR